VADTDPPTPDPMTFASNPTANGEDSISMTATTASDPSGVEYFFDETTGNPGGSDSGWQDSSSYTDTGLNAGTQYCYQVKARDKSPNQNETAYSTSECATTTSPDTTPPTPDPLVWASVPAAISSSAIEMIAATASDPSGVEYYFDETSGNPGGSDSGWQDSPSYTDSGLNAETQYCYQVKARDKSTNQNETAYSSNQCATTQPAPAAPTVVYPDGGSEQEMLAAKEIRRYIYLRTDQLLTTQAVTSLPGSGDLILVANDDNPMVENLRSLVNHTTNPGGFIIKTVNSSGRDILVVTGNDSNATLQAAYRYAEHLGIFFGLAGDTIPDAKITLDITGFDEVGEPLFETRGIQPYHDFPEGPDLWNTDDYIAVISQLPKLGMNFIGIHTYTTWNSWWDYENNHERGPEPSVWIGLPQDVNPDGTVSWSYPAYYAHTKRPNYIWGFDTWDTDQFSGGANQLFPTNGYGSDVIGESVPTNMAGYIAVSDRAGALFNEAFTHAQNIGVKTATGTELPLGVEVDGGDTWVRGMPPELQTRLTGMSLDPADPAVVKDVYKGIFERIMKTHPLDYYWLWSYEIWANDGATSAEIQSFENDITIAQQALSELGNPFQIAHAGWILGTSTNPAEFEDVFPSQAPFFSLLGSAIGFESLSAQRVKWPGTWLEYDWGLAQPQLALYRIHEDALAAWNKNCDGFITELWRTRIMSSNIGSMKDLIWAYGPTGTPVTETIPSDIGVWMDA
ncbi:MAG: hypothetical protein ACYTEE_10865, partial [Planctomycetota bacterium]